MPEPRIASCDRCRFVQRISGSDDLPAGWQRQRDGSDWCAECVHQLALRTAPTPQPRGGS